jgi:cytoskeleton protein RodZ
VIEPQEAVIEAEEVAAPPAETETPAPRPVATMRLGLQFNQESWVEISDANRRLLFGLQREGYRREVTGEPPFNLLIGNAHGVALTIDDEPFDVPASRMRGKVARFKITGNESE